MTGRIIRRPAVAVVCIGATIGKVARISAPVLTNQQINTIVPAADRFDPLFCYYAVQPLKDYLQRIASGSATPILSKARFTEVALLLPPIEEQRGIAGILGALDDLIDTNKRLIHSCTAAAATAFRQLVAAARESVVFSETVDILSGGTPKTSEPAFWEGSIPWFSVVDTPADGEAWVLRTSKHITDLGLENSPAQLLEPGTTIVTARGTVGNVALVGVPMAMNQSCYGLRSLVGHRGYFTFFATLASVDALRQRAHGSVFDTITRASFDAVDVPLPLQGEIEAFESLVDPLMQQARELLWESDALRRSRDKLLPLLLSGRVRVQEVAA
jgi:type I restriction enzyme, S subunit